MTTAVGFFAGEDVNRANTQTEDASTPAYTGGNKSEKLGRGSSLMLLKKNVKVSKLLGVYKRQSTDIVGEFADTTSTHGLSRIHKYHASKSYIMFLFWIGVFGLCSYYCGRGIYLQVKLYLAQPVTTSTSIVRLDSMPMPDFKICPLLPYNKTRFRQIAEEVGMAEIFITDGVVPKEQMIELITRMGSNHTLVMERIQSTAFTFDEVVRSCKIRGMDCSTEENPGDTMTTVYDIANGNCFILSTNQSQIKPGLQFGLNLVLWNSLSESLSTDLFGTAGMGVRVVVGDESDALPPTTGSLASVATQTELQLSRTDYIDNTAQRDCVTPPKNTRYSPQTCMADCVTNEMRMKCNCTNYVDCITNRTTLVCMDEPQTYEQSLRICSSRKICKDPCVSTKYTIQASMALWPSDATVTSVAFELVTKGLCGDDPDTSVQFEVCKKEVETSLQQVLISFPDFSYTEFTRDNQFTLEQLMSQVGGLTGLFIGSSFMSIVELFEMLLLVFAVHTSHTHKLIKKRAHSKSQNSISGAGI